MRIPAQRSGGRRQKVRASENIRCGDWHKETEYNFRKSYRSCLPRKKQSCQIATFKQRKEETIMSNEHIRDFLNYYCDLPVAPQYAVLLNGLWGSGKTWFISDFIKKNKDAKRFLYISLYGVQSFEDIESKLYALLHPLLSSKPARILGSILKGTLKATINIDVNGDKKPDGNISIGTTSEKIIETSIKENQILVFDDLERCSIPITDLLGYINQFIEHGEVKSIVIANEIELLKIQKNSGETYKQIKEKVIGRTFEINPDIKAAIDFFTSEINDDEAKTIINENIELITNIYEKSEYKNLRIIRHTLWDFSRLFKKIDSKIKSRKNLISDLLGIFLSHSLEIRSGSITPPEIHELSKAWMFGLMNNKNTDENKLFQKIHKKYSTLLNYETLIPASVWENFFLTGSIDSEKFNESLLNSKYFQNDTTENWVKLWYGRNLSDEDFEQVLLQVESEWENQKYDEIGIILHIAGIFLFYEKEGFLTKNEDTILEETKENIRKIFNKNKNLTTFNTQHQYYERESYAGLGFHSTDNKKFNELFDFIEETKATTLKSSIPEKASALLDLMKSDTNLFFNKLILNNNADNIYYETPILNHIPPEKFIFELLKIKPDDRKIIGWTLNERYKFDNFNKKLLAELPWLREIKALLNAEIVKRKGKISGVTLKELVTRGVEIAITNLEASQKQFANDLSNSEE